MDRVATQYRVYSLRNRSGHNRGRRIQPPTYKPGRAGPDTSGGSNADRLRQLAELGELHRDGVLTDAEFAAEKARILDQ
jgi:Short C-terminal domain